MLLKTTISCKDVNLTMIAVNREIIYWISTFIKVFTLIVIAEANQFTHRCAVQDSLAIHPELSREPPSGFHFLSTINARLISRVKTRRDTNAFAALFDGKMKCDEEYLVPVAWHVIYSSNGVGNVTKATLDKQIQVLNDAFQGTGLTFRTKSIDFTKNTEWTKRCLQKSTRFMRSLAVSPPTTLNLYTCKFSAVSSGVGKASMPWWFREDSHYHGVVIHTDTLPGGSLAPINQGKNTVHEVGHYFGLFHVFEGGCTNMDDRVDDTPRCKPSYGCPSNNLDTCPKQPGKDPVHNYMGYTDDYCMTEFTAGQIKRMKWAVEKYRPTLMKTVKYPCTVDAIFRWSNGYIYLFSGSNYYQYNESRPGLDPDYPRPIATHWTGVPDNIDGAFRYANGITYFFKGKYYYRFNDVSGRVDPGYPQRIDNYWHGVPSDIDDVISSSNSYTYFFKGSQYYRFNPRVGRVDVSYPRHISEYWVGVPRDIEAAITWYNGGVYFFKDAQYWFFLHGERDIGVSDKYPKPIRHWWKGDTRHLTGYSVFRHSDGYSYFFHNNQCWRYNDNLYHVDYQYPQQVTLSWNTVPGDVKTVFVWSDSEVYFFKGSSYYRYNTSAAKVDNGYPKRIGEFWKGVPNDVDAVFRYVNGVTYFFKGSHYYRFNDSTLQVDHGYPKPIASYWKGVPSNIDTVFVWSNGHTYFFKENLYYRFNCNVSQVEKGYPKSIFRWRGILYLP